MYLVQNISFKIKIVHVAVVVFKSAVKSSYSMNIYCKLALDVTKIASKANTSLDPVTW